MSISRVRVGQPLGGFYSTMPGGLQWSAKTRSRKESAGRRRLNLTRPASARPAPEPVTAEAQAVPEISGAPLNFMSLRHFTLMTALALGIILLVLGLMRSNHQAVAHSYELSDLTQQKLGLLEVNRQLKAELAQVGSLDQLEVKARALGLVTPRQGRIVVID
ncbi:MAG: hypothetical protein LBP33_08440 [Candidatus Adiutrix sp.]|jgi:hypothetical protein|nr:hypothetical protein [Candidatus Adiutrix sp.]